MKTHGISRRIDPVTFIIDAFADQNNDLKTKIISE